MNSKIILTIFIFAINFNLILGQISCNYIFNGYEYICDLTINNPNGLNNFANIGGIHLSGYTDSDVTKIETTSGSITTNIPSIICSKFRNIQIMVMWSNGITRIDDYSFIDCTAINGITLYRNQISSIHERAFNRNLNLLDIYIQYNRLTTLPENVFQNQQRLESLMLDFNYISDLPANIFRSLTSLRQLILQSNQLRSIRNEWFELLPNIRYLSITDNILTDLPKNVFTNLKNLQTLDVSGNRIKMIHADSFGFLPNLKTIYFGVNDMNAIDENLIDYTGVSFINMYRNLCAYNDITDNSISRDYMRAVLRECFNNYEQAMSVCRQHSKLMIGSDELSSQTCASEKQIIREMKATIEKLTMKN